MRSGTSRASRKHNVGRLPATAMLALWQMRQVWKIFTLVALGMIAAVILVGATPLFAAINTTASIRSAFTNTGLDPSSSARATIESLNPVAIKQTTQQLKQDYRQYGGSFFDVPPAVSLQLTYAPIHRGTSAILVSQAPLFSVHGYDMEHIASHVQLQQGRLPQAAGVTADHMLEVALTENNASALGAQIGAVYNITAVQSVLPALNVQSPKPNKPIPINLKVVGIVHDLSLSDAEASFWHGDTINYQQAALFDGPSHGSVIASNTGMLTLFSQLSQGLDAATKIAMPNGASLYCYFPLNISAVTNTTINKLLPTLGYFTNSEPARFVSSDVDAIVIDNTNIVQMNGNVGNVTTVVQVPVLALVGLMMGLILFFVTLMTELLVTRQAEAIAVMRSRGATNGQIFQVFVVQSLLLGLLTVSIVPFFIPLLIRAMVTLFFPSITLNALDVLPTTPWGTLLALGWYIWVAVILVILTMYLAVWRTLKNNTLGRSTTQQSTGGQRALWQRLYADVVLALLGILTYGLYTYLTSSGIVNVQLQVVLAAPCMLVAATLLCLAGMLLFLRLFPLLMQWGAQLAARGTGIVPLFSLVMMARAPRQAMRTTLLLILTIAFALFAQVFLATQTQREGDIANYITFADVSGFMMPTNVPQDTFEQQEARYQHIPGVLSASLASVSDQSFQDAGTPTSLTVIATNPSSIGNSFIWSHNDSLTSINAVLKHLADQRTAFAAALAKTQQGSDNTSLPPIPALVSAATSRQMHLAVGQLFFISDASSNRTLAFIDSGEVSYLPGVPDLAGDHGLLVDYDSFNAAYNVVIANGAPLSLTNVWLHTQQDPATLTNVLHALSSAPFQITTLVSRQKLLTTLQADPLFLNLLCMLGLGIGLALLLAWVGCLASAWSYMRVRLRSLLVLRALGSTPAQLALLLSWEQLLIYATAIILGIGCGVGFTALTLPQLVFSSTAQINAVTSGAVLNLFQLQSTPPLQIIIPATVVIGLGVVALLCLVGIGLTATMVVRLSPAQMLRLSEDYVEEAPVRSEKPTAPVQTPNQAELVGRRPGLVQALELGRALTSLRQSWSTLGLTQLGVLISVLFVCVVPLFSQVAATAGLRDVLTLPTNRNATVNSSLQDTISLGYVQSALAHGTASLNKTLFGQAGSYFHTSPTVMLSKAQIDLPSGAPKPTTSASTVSFTSLSARDLADQVHIVQGHLPPAAVGADGTLQIMLTPQAANYLHVHVGDVLTPAQGYLLDMQLVGLFQPHTDLTAMLPTASDFFYYSNPLDKASGLVTALTSTEGLAQVVDAFGRTQQANNPLFVSTVTWSYPIDETVTSLQLGDLITTLSSLHQQQEATQPNTFTLSTIKTPLDALQQYQQGVIVSNIPLLCLSVLIIALMLLFLNFMVGLLVEREANAIAMLRSRGATQRQIFAAFLKRALFINGIGWLAGMVLAIPVIILLTRLILQPEDQAGLLVLADHPWQTFWSLAGFASVSIIITLLAMGFMLSQATRMDYLSLRREMTRETRKPLWQRWYLDVVGIILALVAYGFSLYLTNSNILDAAVNVQVKSPLILAATICLVLACTLVLLRLFPLLLRLGTKIAMRNKGVESMLALSQIAHAPRQRLRTALLLLLTSGFVVFVVIFNASQTQHISDTAQYWAGSDFSGSLQLSLTPDQVDATQQAYQHVKGVTSVAMGDMEALHTNDGSQQMQLLAVTDLKRFMQTVNWPGLSTMTPVQQQTISDRLNNPLGFSDLKSGWEVIPASAIPVVISPASAQKLQVHQGQAFTIPGHFGQIILFVAAEVSGMPEATLLTDYSIYNIDYNQQSRMAYSGSGAVFAPINYLWLKTDGRAQSLQNVRQSLESGPLHLSTFYDRAATAQTLTYNPLNLNLVGMLALGTFAPLLLTWIGCLMAALMEMRQRQLLFGVLRALGSTPAQLARVLGWEQALIFGTSVVLGALFGLLTAFLALPSLVLTSVLPRVNVAGSGNLASSVQDLFAWQSTIDARTVIPPTLGIVVALLIVLAFLAVALMTRSALRIALGQTLRLNED